MHRISHASPEPSRTGRERTIYIRALPKARVGAEPLPSAPPAAGAGLTGIKEACPRTGPPPQLPAHSGPWAAHRRAARASEG